MQKPLVEIGGIKYMSVNAAAKLWDISSPKVTTACREERVVGATKDSGNHYIIPIDSKKPLDKETIRITLIALLAMKNRPELQLIDETQTYDLFVYLSGIKMIEGNSFNNATLTNKGMELATAGKPIHIDWINISTTVLGIVGNLASIWSVIPK